MPANHNPLFMSPLMSDMSEHRADPKGCQGQFLLVVQVRGILSPSDGGRSWLQDLRLRRHTRYLGQHRELLVLILSYDVQSAAFLKCITVATAGEELIDCSPCARPSVIVVDKA